MTKMKNILVLLLACIPISCGSCQEDGYNKCLDDNCTLACVELAGGKYTLGFKKFVEEVKGKVICNCDRGSVLLAEKQVAECRK